MGGTSGLVIGYSYRPGAIKLEFDAHLSSSAFLLSGKLQKRKKYERIWVRYGLYHYSIAVKLESANSTARMQRLLLVVKPNNDFCQ